MDPRTRHNATCYVAGEGLFSTIAIVGILVAAGTCSWALLITASYAAFVTFMVALPAVSVLIDTEIVMLGMLCANPLLLAGMFLAVLFRSEFRSVVERKMLTKK